MQLFRRTPKEPIMFSDEMLESDILGANGAF